MLVLLSYLFDPSLKGTLHFTVFIANRNSSRALTDAVSAEGSGSNFPGSNTVEVKYGTRDRQAFVLLLRESGQQGTSLAEIRWIRRLPSSTQGNGVEHWRAPMPSTAIRPGLFLFRLL